MTTAGKNKVLLFNPRSANAKHRVPNSILQVGASIHGRYEYVPVESIMKATEVICKIAELTANK